MPADAATMDGSFSAGLLDPARPVPAHIVSQAPKRFAIYRNNVTVGLVRALEANFPAIRKLLGAGYFAGMAVEFVRAHPPRSPLMFLYGDAFAAFLAQQADLQNYPYLPDIARLEQQWRLSYHAADAPVLQAQQLASCNSGELGSLRLVAHPALAVLVSDYAVCSIFRSARGISAEAAIRPATPECVLVARPQHEVQVQLLSRATASFIKALARGETFADAAGQGFTVSSDFDLTASLTLMLQAGAFQPLT